MTGVTTWYLDMTSPSQLKEARQDTELVITEAEIRQYQVNRFLYQFIGKEWRWVDKLSWSDEQWQAWVDRDSLRLWMAYESGSLAGYYELERSGDGDVEVAYFGLAPTFIGKGYGGYLLSHAVQSAWAWEGTKRVWVHTCTLDHPGALHNYKSRGFQIYREEKQ